jgi:hypothetical protein
MPGVFRRCSSCKKDIALGARYWVCSVSTCNRNRTALAFCSTDCWDAHLGFVNHRESWAEERKAPLSLDPPPASPSPHASPPAAVAAASREPRRTIVPSPAAIESRPAKTAPAPEEEEILIVASKLKAYIRATSEMNTSDRVFDVLSDEVRRIADLAVEEARREGRKTVLDRDFAAVTGARRGKS